LGEIHGGEALILLFRNQAIQQSMGVVLSGSGNGNLVPWSLNQPVSATLIRREHLPLHNTTTATVLSTTSRMFAQLFGVENATWPPPNRASGLSRRPSTRLHDEDFA
jgi:hypothetical protein